jgi:hypothetical protein
MTENRRKKEEVRMVDVLKEGSHLAVESALELPHAFLRFGYLFIDFGVDLAEGGLEDGEVLEEDSGVAPVWGRGYLEISEVTLKSASFFW